MAVYLITYDLKKPGQDYEKLYEEIKSLGTWWHYLESNWMVDTTYYNTSSISEKLKKVIDKNDYLLVIRVMKDYAGWLPPDAWDWLNQRNF